MNQPLYDQLRNAGGVLYYQAAAYSKIKDLEDEIEDDEIAVEESESDITGKYPPGYNLKNVIGFNNTFSITLINPNFSSIT